MSGHTQDGPWVDAGLSGPNPTIRGGPLRLIKCQGVVVAFLPAWLDDEHEEARANATLISAAPLLLEALRIMLGTAGEAMTAEQRLPIMQKARAAIAAATGEKP